MKVRYFKIVAAIVAVLAFGVSCSKEEEDGSEEFNVSGIILPETIDCESGGTIELQVVGGHGPAKTDIVQLAGDQTFKLDITSVASSSFSFKLSNDVFSGDYVLSIVRGSQTKRVGKTKLSVTSGGTIDPDGATVYGMIAAKGTGVEGVVVSDGIEVTTTDANGIYRLNSKKKHGYVFMSIPSGYEALSNGILPVFHKTLSADASTAERVDFTLVPVSGQENATLLMLGDIHLARRTGDRDQFAEFVSDVNSYVSSSTGKIYGITLGDMTWDYYWKVNNYGYSDYIKDANTIKNLSIFHTIGNHDHSMYYTGDFDTVAEYKQLIAPTYYSFNIGKVHCVVLDNIQCTNSTATTDSNGNPCYVREYYGNIVNEQFNWLNKDLSYVSTDTPLMVMMHIPLCNEDGTYRLSASNASKLEAIFAKYPETHVFTGHTHHVYNIDRTSTDKYYEHNAGAVCGTWWWSAYETPGVHIGQDGSPGGYMILNLKGDDFSWQFKATGSETSYQFRSYDRNNIQITADKYIPAGGASYKAALEAGRWETASSANEVYVNVWNYDPSWKVEIFEGTKSLTVNQVSDYDPLHLIAYTCKRLNKSADASFATVKTTHLFYATAASANTTVTVRVTDQFGNVYKETMERPKTFDIATYEK